MNTEILDQISLEALEQTQTAIAAYHYPRLETYYTFADKSIIPTFLTKPFSRRQVGTRQRFYTLRASEEISGPSGLP